MLLQVRGTACKKTSWYESVTNKRKLFKTERNIVFVIRAIGNLLKGFKELMRYSENILHLKSHSDCSLGKYQGHGARDPRVDLLGVFCSSLGERNQIKVVAV